MSIFEEQSTVATSYLHELYEEISTLRTESRRMTDELENAEDIVVALQHMIRELFFGLGPCKYAAQRASACRFAFAPPSIVPSFTDGNTRGFTASAMTNY